MKKPKPNESNGDAEEKPKVVVTPNLKACKSNSIEEGKKMLEWILSPNLSVDDFMQNYWEKKPKLIQRSASRDFYSSLLSTDGVNAMLKDNYLEYTKNIDVTSYVNGVRETHNPVGRAVRFHPSLTHI